MVSRGINGNDRITFFARRRDTELYLMVADHYTPAKAAAAAKALLRIDGKGKRRIISADKDLPMPEGVKFYNIIEWMMKDAPAPETMIPPERLDDDL
ncbi:MAG: hypothetical protein PHF83_05795 [Candidatus Methanomethylophilus sp.]|nr:hypothetical protein [Methanomethylophilus sp.]MDD4669054.1 hypothetical protein [Methanomethylophilus sp.]